MFKFPLRKFPILLLGIGLLVTFFAYVGIPFVHFSSPAVVAFHPPVEASTTDGVELTSGRGNERKGHVTAKVEATTTANASITETFNVTEKAEGALGNASTESVLTIWLRPETARNSTPWSWRIELPPKCGASGFKSGPEDKWRMPEWAEGSAPFPSEITLPEPESTEPYFTKVNKELLCYNRGTNFPATLQTHNVSQCVCLPGYHGDECGIPSPVWHSEDFKEWVAPYLTVRPTVRRIIQAVPLNHELELTNVRMHELGNSVTATLLSESDFSAAGELKGRFAERRAREDPSFLGPYRNRTILLRADSFPPGGCNDGWISDAFSRSFIGTAGLRRLHGLKDDDFFLLFDADEIPRREVIDFLRFYEGYREPIMFRMRWFVYGFFWETLEAGDSGKVAATRIEAGCSVGMLRRVYNGDPYFIRREEWVDKAVVLAREYEKAMGRRLRTFEIGSAEHPGGFHCSWCFGSAEGLQIKLVSAQPDDGPRWGSYPEKLKPEYLERIVQDGEWFDGRRNFAPRRLSDQLRQGALAVRDFAPSYILQHFHKYSYLLINPSERGNRTLMDWYEEETAKTLRPSGDRDSR